MADKTNNKKGTHNWVAIKADYQAGFEVPHIAKKYGVSPSTIYSRIKRDTAKGNVWGKTLKEKVKSRTNEIMALTHGSEVITPDGMASFSQELAAVEASALANVMVVQGHRHDIKSARSLAEQYKVIVAKAMANPHKMLEIKGKAIEVELDPESLGKSLNHYTKALQTLLMLERTAHSLDEKKDPEEQEFTYEID